MGTNSFYVWIVGGIVGGTEFHLLTGRLVSLVCTSLCRKLYKILIPM
jgi:hypothetical protein